MNAQHGPCVVVFEYASVQLAGFWTSTNGVKARIVLQASELYLHAPDLTVLPQVMRVGKCPCTRNWFRCAPSAKGLWLLATSTLKLPHLPFHVEPPHLTVGWHRSRWSETLDRLAAGRLPVITSGMMIRTLWSSARCLSRRRGWGGVCVFAGGVRLFAGADHLARR